MAVFCAFARAFQILDQLADKLSLRHSLISQKNSSTAAQAAHHLQKNTHTLGYSSYWRTSLRVRQDSQPFISLPTAKHPIPFWAQRTAHSLSCVPSHTPQTRQFCGPCHLCRCAILVCSFGFPPFALRPAFAFIVSAHRGSKFPAPHHLARDFGFDCHPFRLVRKTQPVIREWRARRKMTAVDAESHSISSSCSRSSA